MSSLKPLFALLILACCGCVWNGTENEPDYLPIDDSEYPFADLPRLVIETENFAQIRDKETIIPAKMQIYGKDKPESEILDLVLKGRGNSSLGMSKYNMKMKLSQKREMFGMPADKEWILISNHADKTLLRNYMTFHIAQQLQMDYVPRSTFVELFLNRDYMGVYLLTENIKLKPYRLNIPKDENHYLVEVDAYYGKKDTVVKTNGGLPLKIHNPKNCDNTCQTYLKTYMNQWELFIQKAFSYDSLLSDWIYLQDYITYYWIEEFSKNVDSNLKTSVYFSWEKDGKIKMGPIWDFDLSYGEYNTKTHEGWYSRWNTWNKYLFKNAQFDHDVSNYWRQKRDIFASYIDSLDTYRNSIQKAARNNFKRWPILETTFLWEFTQSYDSHQEAVDSLKSWMRQRLSWIDKNIR